MKRSMAIAVMSFAVAACSSSASSAPTTAAPVTTTAAVATSPATDPTTTPSTTSTTTATVATTAPAQTTTTVATEDLIKQAVQDYAVAYHQCGAVPSACDPTTFTATQGHSRATITELATGMVKQGLYFSSDQRGSYSVAGPVTIVSSTEATVVFCDYDAGIVMGPNGPDGLPTVVNDQIISLRNEYHLFLEDGIWRVGEQLELEQLGEGNLCPSAA